MDAIALLDIISAGETSKVQFKRELTNPDEFAKEIVAMANSLGGIILLGVKDKTGEIVGLSTEELHDYGTRVANIANDKVISVVYITTEVVSVKLDSVKKILVIHINEGINKPYKVRKTLKIYVKQGDTKRSVSDNAEILRLFQNSGNLSADEMEVFETSVKDINQENFEAYFQKEFKKTIEQKGLTYEQALRNKRILRNNKLTLAGLLFFGDNPQSYKPAFCIKTVSFFGNSVGGKDYRSKPTDMLGTIPELFEKGMIFFNSNLKHIQKGQEFNSPGILEISRIALEELLQNALIHRDYLINSPIRLFIFDNRIEIISPGKLPNNLTVEEIKFGNTVIRNNQLVAFSTITMPFSGIGSGIKRALEAQPNIEFENNTEAEYFKVTINRP